MRGSLTGPGWTALLTAAADGDRAATGALRRLLRRRGHLRPGATLPPGLAEQLWLVVLGPPVPDPVLWDLLRGRPTGGPWVRALAWLTGAPLDGASLDDPMVRAAAVKAAGRDDGHPVAALARDRVLDCADDAVLAELSRLAFDRPGLAAWCVANGVLPPDPPDAAALLLLAGEPDRYRALDPDGALLATAFAAAPAQRRGRLLAALAGADAGVDLGSLAAGRVGREPAHRAFVVEHLTGRGDRPAAWRMIWDLPVAEAVAAAHRLGPWRPGRDAELFAVLVAADPDRLPGAVAELSAPVRVPVRGTLDELALSPDASRLAVRYRAEPGAWEILDDVDLATGRVVHRYANRRVGGQAGRRRGMVYFGQSIVDAAAADARRTAGLRRSADGRQSILHGPAGFTGVWRLGAGFVALRTDGTLLFGGPDGVERSAGPVRRSMHHDDNGQWLAVAPDGRHLAVGVEEAVVLLDGAGAPVLTRPGTRFRGVAFAAADQLVALDRAGATPRLTRWRFEGDRLTEEAATDVPGADDLDAVDGAGLLVLADGRRASRLRDALTLEPRDLDGIGLLPGRPYPRAAAGRVAVGLAREVVVRPHPAYELATRPLGDLAPADLGTVRDELANGPAAPAARELLTVLHDCLRARFATDITLGGPVRPAGDTDIVVATGERD
ncbi:hypothetical protein ACFFX1_45375 [Dactylosporangium sucinum]|uniref:Uncharacterized protein n=1 Tax=Dactylosporangium sucinum TaxID=1424081 RepID=A0A917U2C7_9ACTN|nr:hypothetical protein [Dactylosporangium sucinum]GGM48010.1 hypothetical protein GCM10007977_057020 [Dactylosporangium sucinum]